MLQVYEPAEDSFFFAEFLKQELPKVKNYKELKFLDMGCGSSILADTANEVGIKEIITSDINPDAVKLSKQKGYKSYNSNLFSKIPKNEKFDIICFNAPYLPEDKNEPKESKLATTGGKKGDEVSLKFLKQAKKYLKKEGKIFLLVSSLTPMDRIEKYNPENIAKKKIFFEELIILTITS